ncbi:MAG: (2Fe-2S)-binding protein [Conexivisphaerales archaeon]
MRIVTFKVNGLNMSAKIEDNEILHDVLRDKLGVKSVKAACWARECGLCTALINGKPVKTCMVLAASADGSEIVTAEGLGKKLSPLQESFVKHAALQCGFCTPAFVVTAHYLLQKNPNPSKEEIKEALDGLLCRCGIHYQIIDAIKEASSKTLVSQGDQI